MQIALKRCMRNADLTEAIIGAAMEVSNTLGAGFLEKVYRRALAEELRMREVETEVRYRVGYKGLMVGEYVADLVVARSVVVELKVADCIVGEHVAQLVNYLKAAELGVGLVFNFGHPRLEWKRVVAG